MADDLTEKTIGPGLLESIYEAALWNEQAFDRLQLVAQTSGTTEP
jgi:hypothetical protein